MDDQDSSQVPKSGMGQKKTQSSNRKRGSQNCSTSVSESVEEQDGCSAKTKSKTQKRSTSVAKSPSKGIFLQCNPLSLFLWVCFLIYHVHFILQEKITLFMVMSAYTAPTFVQSAGAVSRLGPTWWSTCTCISQTQPCSAPTANTTSLVKASYASTCFERPARSCTTATCVSTEQWSATPSGDTSPVCMETRQGGNTTQTSTPAQLVETPSNRARCSRPT